MKTKIFTSDPSNGFEPLDDTINSFLRANEISIYNILYSTCSVNNEIAHSAIFIYEEKITKVESGDIVRGVRRPTRF